MGTTNHIYGGRIASFRMEDITGASFCLTADGNSFDVGYSTELIEAVTFGDTVREFIPGIADYTVTFSGFYRTEGSENAASLLHEIVGASVGSWFQANPAGSAATCPAYSGCVHVESMEVATPVDGIVTMNFTLRPRSGSLSYIADGSW